MTLARTRQQAPGHEFAVDPLGTPRTVAGDAGVGRGTTVVATARGVRLSGPDSANFYLGLETASVGRDGSHHAQSVIRQRTEGQELVLDREDDVEERLLAGPLGVEHSFVVRSRPEGQGALVFEVAFDGLSPAMPSSGTGNDHVLLCDREGRVRAGYRDLLATDAEGHELVSRMEVRGQRVALVIEDAQAVYPVLVDPLVWTQVAEVTPSDESPSDDFGTSVALSGSTAIVGAGYGQQGAAYVFVQSGATWTQQAKLVPSDGLTGDDFVYAVALSGDTAAVAGGANDYIFVRNGTTWTQQAEFVGFNEPIVLNGDTAAVVGATGVYIFVRSGSSWAWQSELTPGPRAAINGFVSPALSGSTAAEALSGDTAVLGAAGIEGNNTQGVVDIFVRAGATWTLQTELTASDGAPSDLFGAAVGMTGDTVLVGAPGQGNDLGAAYVFVRSGTTWTQQAKLTLDPLAGYQFFGTSAALSYGTAGVGLGEDLLGAAYIFGQTGATWSQQAELTTPDATAGVGNPGAALYNVALSGGTAIVGRQPSGSPPRDCGPGGPSSCDGGENVFVRGAAYFFQLEPCDADSCSPFSDAGSGCPGPACIVAVQLDAGAVQFDGGFVVIAEDAAMPNDAASGATTAPDATLTDSGAPVDSGTKRRIDDASIDATTRPEDAGPDASARSSPAGSGDGSCRTTAAGDPATAPAWPALGPLVLLGRWRRRRRATMVRERSP
jgi:hypothetical protein